VPRQPLDEGWFELSRCRLAAQAAETPAELRRAVVQPQQAVHQGRAVAQSERSVVHRAAVDRSPSCRYLNALSDAQLCTSAPWILRNLFFRCGERLICNQS
jgi:hypothetical protein